MRRKVFILWFVLLLPYFSYTQGSKFSGVVYDGTSRLPLAFVSVAIKGTNTGTITDIDGQFSFNRLSPGTLLLISYIGYKTSEYKTGQATGPVSIFIERAPGQLEDVVVSSSENPAHRIIRLLQQNKKRNDPEQQSSFSYNAYTIAALAAGNRFWNMNRSDTGKQKEQNLPAGQLNKLAEKAKDTAGDAQGAILAKRFRDNYLLVTESYTQRIYKFPGQSKETVLATRFSGLKNATFGVTTSDFQPFGFYKDYLLMNNKKYVSPVISGSISMYKFRLKETLLHENDTTYIISFEPRKGKNFSGLKGLLYVNSDGYAIENIQASPANETGMIFTFRLQQKYERVKGRWFPSQLNTMLSQKDLRTDSVLLYWDSRCYITNAEIGKPLTKSDFSDVQLEYHPRAGRQTDSAWALMRTDTLNEKSKLTYETFEMLPPRYKNTIEKVNKAFQVLAIEGIPWGKVDIPFKHIISGINKYESFRIGAGLQTNPLLSKWFSAGVYAGYGLRDKAFKYGGNLQFHFQQRTNTTLRFDYSRDITEPGNVDYFVRNGSVFSNQSLRNFQRSRMDSVQQFKINFSSKLRPFIQSDIWLLNEQRQPAAYEYVYDNNGSGKSFRRFRNTEIGIGFRFARGESFTRMGRSKVRTRSATTQFLFQLSKGLNSFLDGELDYTKAAIQISHKLTLKKLGETSLQLDAGVVWGQVPYSYLFNTRATNTGRKLTLYVPNHFQTAGLYEFASSKTVSLFAEHNFGNLLFKPKNLSFRPEFILVQAISYGRLDNAAAHKFIAVKVPEKGLFESGLMIRNLYRRSILSFAYLGIGGGVFYRYGHYALPRSSDNWAFKWSISISF
jgi:hypothetical protein